jgi:hypothetical protein
MSKASVQQISKTILVVFIFPIICGLISISFGKKITWDLLSYHYYNGYAFLNGRLGFDIAPVGIQTYLNPVVDILFYSSAQYFSPKRIQFILGAVQGFNLSLLFLIFWEVTNIHDWKIKTVLGMVLVSASFLAPGYLLELGSTGYDNIISIFVLLSILLLININDQLAGNKLRSAIISAGLAGLLLGVGTGIKLYLTIYAISILFVWLFFIDGAKNKIIVISIIGILFILGVLISGGFWFSTLWLNFKNPIFPFYNNIFKSNYISPEWQFIYYEPYIPDTLWQYLTWPLIFSRNSKHVVENSFVDIRFGLTYLIILIAALRIVLVKTKNNNQLIEPKKATILFFFFIASFTIWMSMFSYYRFLIVLEILIPMIILILLDKLSDANETRIVAGLVVVVSIILTFNPDPSSIKGGKWDDRFFKIDSSSFPSAENTIIIFLGRSPMGYIIPEAPPQIRFVRPDWNFVPQEQQGLIYEETNNLLSQHNGPIYVVYNEADFSSLDITNSLGRFKLDYHPDNCGDIRDNIAAHLIICKLTRKMN